MSFDGGGVAIAGIFVFWVLVAAFQIGWLRGYKLGKRDGYMFPIDKGEVK